MGIEIGELKKKGEKKEKQPPKKFYETTLFKFLLAVAIIGLIKILINSIVT